jgi:hypothetical protein
MTLNTNHHSVHFCINFKIVLKKERYRYRVVFNRVVHKKRDYPEPHPDPKQPEEWKLGSGSAPKR